MNINSIDLGATHNINKPSMDSLPRIDWAFQERRNDIDCFIGSIVLNTG